MSEAQEVVQENSDAISIPQIDQSEQKQQLAEISRIEQGLAALEEKELGVLPPDCMTNEGMTEAKLRMKPLDRARIDTEKARKALKAPLIAMGKEVDRMANDVIQSRLLKMSEPLKTAMAEAEKQKAEIAAEAARVEQARIERLEEGVKSISSIASRCLRVEACDQALEKLGLFNPEKFEEFAETAIKVHEQAVSDVREIRERLSAQEAEAARLAEQKAEQERVAKEQADEAKKIAADQARIAAEQKAAAEKLAADQKAFADQQAEVARKEQEAEEAKRIEQARLDREAAQAREVEEKREAESSLSADTEQEVSELTTPDPESLAVEVEMPVEMISIPLAEYKELVEDQKILNALRAGGVDNWDWYEASLERLEEE